MRADRMEHDGVIYVSFDCPGCKVGHQVTVAGKDYRWQWNGSLDLPTITPSVLVTWEANPNASPEFKEWHKKRVCHSFVTDGRIQFLGDCTHELAGQTVDLPQL